MKGRKSFLYMAAVIGMVLILAGCKDQDGQAGAAHHDGHQSTVSSPSAQDTASNPTASPVTTVTTTPEILHGPVIRLTAEESNLDPGTGEKIPVWTYNNSVPGPQIRVKVGETVKVILTNKLPVPTTIHWHGVPVPNDQDGVPGVTQDAVEPGQTFTYEFKATTPGTYWYHSHQNSVQQVDKGLYGAFIVEDPKDTADRDYTLMLDEWFGASNLYTINGKTGHAAEKLTAKPGEKVRIRMINAGSLRHDMYLKDQMLSVVATDGQPVNGPQPFKDKLIGIAAGERYDIEFTMPASGGTVLEDRSEGDLAKGMTAQIVTEGSSSPEVPSTAASAASQGNRQLSLFDYNSYGTAAKPKFSLNEQYDKEYILELGTMQHDNGVMYTINGKAFPDVPPITVKEGDRVKVKMVNQSQNDDHPMHLHGHTFQVLERNGVPSSGAPIMKDTVDLQPGEEVTVAFLADNPGYWMYHCHVLSHASKGMMIDVNYEGYQSAYQPDEHAHNMPE
ncbi:multicopper oxidase family protein [Paenibacillus sp. JX-17]|uniref:Multicopper oxidase family protein n=1 Tax=Paenibacillus lacisoli TaxID=3064525 RepID=A0ABT9CGM1_9BACL|nr:multicopper oxidase family protein [Paenibacillus sp. JX-17]MDO7906763.1 multicopper oxidase family protein [Paenibacillus sp. JX-17]